jgi:triacylglycerol lipase
MDEPNPRAAWRRELDAYLMQGRLVAAAALRRARRVDGEQVVVFVHGFMAAGPVFDPMRSHVETATGLTTLDFTYSPMSSFEGAASRLAACIRAHVPGKARIALVGHSLGGLLARWYVQEMGGADRVDRLVTLATPHAGTVSARVVPLPLVYAARPGGPVVRRLAATSHVFDRLPHLAVAAGGDWMVQPVSSAASAPGARVVWVAGVGHNELLYDPRTHHLVSEALAG